MTPAHEHVADGGMNLALVGFSCRVPGANCPDEFWRNLLEGREASSVVGDEVDLDHADSMSHHVPVAYMLDGVDQFDAPFFGMSPREAALTDPQHRILMECAYEALEHSGHAAAQGRNVGVYVGSGPNEYLLANILKNPRACAEATPLQLQIGNERDFLANRVSYKLDLRGPSVVVQSACSTSLLAVHMAAMAVYAGECDMALAGGVSVEVPQGTGYLYQAGGIFSPDGRCRPFSVDAAGSVRGSGAGIVVLKRMADAIADQDCIYAVLRGTATNNDGSAKIGYAAPSIEGQREVIRTALGVAGIDPRSVAYIEAHGTGTALGDPVEVAAIAEAYGGRDGLLGVLGAVKSNIGHLDAAAGVVGLIKGVLALNHGIIPPTLHLGTANPAIDFAAAGFMPYDRSVTWEPGSRPRRAAVSSFGVGGSNVHAVLEEPPTIEPVPTERSGSAILRVSGLTPAAVKESARRVSAFLEETPEVRLHDVSFTLHRGRREFRERMAVVARTSAEAATLLRQGSGTSVFRGVASGGAERTVFMFPGQGTQYPRMGVEYFRASGVFTKEITRCSEILRPLLGLNLLTLLYPDSDEDVSQATDLLAKTHLTQPALFAVEYALARQWMAWGLRPSAMIGHSIGEYVAACLASVLTIEEALTLVTARGQLMESMRPGRMLAVSAAYDDIRGDLDTIIELAAVNRPQVSVLAGPDDAIIALQRHLDDKGIDSQLLDTSHAFHSWMMEPCCADFQAEVSKVSLRAPQIAFMSCLTGDWITDEQATSPGYWAASLRGTVRFADGVAGLASGDGRLFLECGPGRSLSAAVRDMYRDRDDIADVALLPRKSDQIDAEHHKSLVRAQLWCHGLGLDDLTEGEGCRRVALPTYPFQRERHWIEPTSLEGMGVDQASRAEPTVPADPANSADPGEELQDLGLVERLARLWCNALGVESVGTEDNFFDLGADSILSVQIAHKARACGIPLKPRMVLEFPSISKLLDALERDSRSPESHEEAVAGRDDEALIARAWVPTPEDQFEPFPLTDMQHAYWVGRNTPTGASAVAAHAYEELECEQLDVARLQLALRGVIRRHPMLRAVMTPDGTQRILPTVPDYVIGVNDFSDLPPAEVEAKIAEIRQMKSHDVRDCETWPLFDVSVSKLGGGLSRLHISFDLLIIDSWSITVFWQELEARYLDPDHEPDPVPVTFRDYVLAERSLESSPAFARARDYWVARAAEFPEAPALPLSCPPDKLTEIRFVRREARIGAAVWNRLKRRASECGLTPSALLCAAYADNLSAWTESPRFCLNLPAFNRVAVHEEIGEVIGDFTSVLLLEVDCGADVPFRQRAQGVQQRMWDDVAAVQFSGVRLLRAIASHRTEQPIMPYVFTSLIFPGATERSVVGRLGRLVEGISQTPQVWLDCQVFEDGNDLVVNWDSIRDLFDPAMLDSMFDEFIRLVQRLAEDDATWGSTEWRDERAQRLIGPGRKAANETDRVQVEVLLHEGFLRKVKETPTAIAVAAEDMRLTYAELDIASRWVAAALWKQGAEAGDRVAVALPKGWEQVAAVLGVLRGGLAYVPVDPALPRDRAHALFDISGARHAVTSPALITALEWPDDVTPLALSIEAFRPSEAVSAWCDVDVDPASAAYIIFTSGTTGVPKGVLTTHKAATNTVEDINSRFRVISDDRFFGLSSLSFDLSVYDIFGALAVGGRLVLPPDRQTGDPACWERLMRQEGVTVWNSVPALMDLLVSHLELSGADPLSQVRLVLLSGDWIPLTLPNRVARVAPTAQQVSLGGATEASIWSIHHVIEQVEPWWRSVPYGTALANQTFEVLDAHLRPRPDLVPGELHIGGEGLAEGYVGNEEETAHRFIPHPNGDGRLYRTGDLGRWLPTGEIEFLGRTDTQVKINGFRVEIGEIEKVMSELEGVAGCAVVMTPDDHGARRLVAYACAAPGASLDSESVRAHVARKLPAYMVPAMCILLEELPLSSNGKVDRARLPAVTDGIAANERQGPETPNEEAVRALWSAVLGHEDFGVTDTFFSVGGDSRQLTELVLRIRASLLPGFPLRDAFRAPSVRALSQLLDEKQHSGEFRTVSGPTARDHREGAVPLTAAQARLWFHDQLVPGSTTYNLVQPFRLSGPLDVAALRSAFETFVERHDVLSLSFETTGDAPHQVPNGGRPLDFQVIDACDDHEERSAERVIAEEARTPFDLANGPHFRVRLLRLGPEEHALIVAVHHIVWDGWSTSIMVREIGALYRSRNQAALPSPGVSYADVALWEAEQASSGNFKPQIEFWRRQLAPPLPVLALPTEGQIEDSDVIEGARVAFVIDPAVALDFKGVCNAKHASAFMGYLAAWQVLLQWWCRQRDIIVGVPAGHRAHPQLENTIGFLVNSLAIRTEFRGDPDFTDVLELVRERALEAYANQDVPFDHVVQAINPVRRAGESAPVFRTWFLLQDVPLPEWDIPDVHAEMLDAEFLLSVHDIKLTLVATADGGMEGSIDYRVGLFSDSTVRRLTRCLGELVKLLSTQPGTKISLINRTLENLWEGKEEARKQRSWNEIRSKRVPV